VGFETFDYAMWWYMFTACSLSIAVTASARAISRSCAGGCPQLAPQAMGRTFREGRDDVIASLPEDDMLRANLSGQDGLQETWLVRVRGRVQGVGYRDSCVRYAQANGIRGWVRNRRDGSVELTLHGPQSAIATMRTWLQHNVPGAQVTGMDAEQLHDAVERLDGFGRLPTE
jgi:acylphosphatase